MDKHCSFSFDEHSEQMLVSLRIERSRIMLRPVAPLRPIDLTSQGITSEEPPDQSHRRNDPIEEDAKEETGVDPPKTIGKLHPQHVDWSEDRFKEHACQKKKPRSPDEPDPGVSPLVIPECGKRDHHEGKEKPEAANLFSRRIDLHVSQAGTPFSTRHPL